MKKFLYSFLGTMAGIWLSVLLGGLLIILTITALLKNSMPDPVEVKDGTVLRINLSGTVVDRATEQSFLEFIQDEYGTTISMTDIVDAIDAARNDNKISGLLLECGGAEIGLAQCEEIMAAIGEFKKAGKWVMAYSDNYSQADYFVASSADELYVNPVGMIDIHGLSATTFYLKDLLDKIGVKAQVVKVGTYKSAVEPFLLNNMSDANREQIQHFLSRMWGTITTTIAQSRNTKSESINQWADSFLFSQPSSYYLDNGIVNNLIYHRKIDDLVKAKNHTEEAQYVDFGDYLYATRFHKQKSGDKRIAILYALGDITESEEGGIASDRMVPEILDLADNEDIDGLILRVNSGGGSAFASEQIWEALQEFKRKTGKPFYVSMGDVAASGGYYISCGADKIYASPLTLTGSIGIFGVIPEVNELLNDKLGVHTAMVATNTGNFPGIFEPMTESQRNAMQSYVDRGYELFVSRCAESRGLSVDSIKAIAEGRVWDGQSALENGLIDQLGGLRMAINDMAKELGSDYNSIEIAQYPAITDKWWEMLSSLNDADVRATMTGVLDPQSAAYQRMYNRIKNMSPLQCRMNYLYIK